MLCFPVSHVYFFVGGGPKSITKLDGGHAWPDLPSGSASALSILAYVRASRFCSLPCERHKWMAHVSSFLMVLVCAASSNALHTTVFIVVFTDSCLVWAVSASQLPVSSDLYRPIYVITSGCVVNLHHFRKVFLHWTWRTTTYYNTISWHCEWIRVLPVDFQG